MSPELSPVHLLSPDLARQEAYVKEMRDAGFDYSAVVMGAVVKGMRDLGYKSMGTALDELIDNAIQAEATHIHVYAGDGAKPDFMAVMDDGHGMSATMLRLSAVWGAGHHQDDRGGFGKYGYGLPSACVSMGKRFSVYSKLAGSEWYKVVVDLEDIENGQYGRGKRVQVAAAVPEAPPKSLQPYIKKHFKDGLDSGTIVYVDKIDRPTWKTTKTIDRQLKQHFGLIYRNFLRTVAIYVQGDSVKAVDPLFLTPDAQFYGLDDERAVQLPSHSFDVNDPETRKKIGEVRLRYSSLPAGFARFPEDKLRAKAGKTNARYSVLDENNGLIVLRAGRQIDVVRGKRDKELGVNFVINNDDHYWGAELDFDPGLDDEFAITTSKQQVNLSDRMWQLLKENGLFAAIKQLRSMYDDQTAKIREQTNGAQEGQRSPERAMAEADKFMPRPAPSRVAKGQQNLIDEANKRAADAGVAPGEVLPKLTAEAEDRYLVTSEAMAPSAAFYEPVQWGGQTRVVLNERHPFYARIYNGHDSSPAVRDALQLVLLTLAEAELDSDGDRSLFYRAERSTWSQRLMIGIERYEQLVGREDPREEIEVEPEPAAESAA